MAKIQLKLLLFCICILFPSTTKGAYQACVTSLRNIVVYEGTPNTLLACSANTNGSSWSVRSTSAAATTHTITKYDDTVAPAYTNLYAYNRSGLTVRNATTSNASGLISTAGFYMVNFNTTARRASKFVVIRSGPICSCDRSASDAVIISCTIAYADHPVGPISPQINCTADGRSYSDATTTKTPSAVYLSTYTLTITVNDSVPAAYDCLITLSAPTAADLIKYPFLASNAPDFSANFTVCNAVATTGPTTATATPSTTECNCSQCPACSLLDQNCTKAGECSPDGSNLTDIYDECVVKAELYAKCDGCCQADLVCGVVVTLRNDSRWLIHDRLCNDNKCEMVVFDASCMSSGWKLLAEKKISVSGVADYIKAGNSVYIGLNKTDCSESCNRMMNLF